VTHKYHWAVGMEWASTVLLVSSVIFSSLNLYPMNVVLGLVGSAGWLFTGFLWKKNSVIVLNGILTAIYVGGLVLYFLK
jgi:hypothetical protein